MAIKEYSSFSNASDVVVTHNEFDIEVNFEDKTIKGSVEMTLKGVAGQTDQVVLDTRDLHIQNASAEGGVELKFELAEPSQALGTKLTVHLARPLQRDATTKLIIRFVTSSNASAAQWLQPSQTAGGVHPYLFTQCQAIHARSLFPSQDTPSVKSTYGAKVRVPAPLRALMSAAPVGEPQQRGDLIEYSFQQQVAIPSYLFALAVGQLESRQIGPISRVWSEPSIVDAAAFEFANTDRYLQTAIEVAGPYVWNNCYDLLVLPPSFPYGGMENPCLTFVTPTLLAGDRSLDRVVCHEIAHSWTGNLVSCATWEHFFLNEGWTMFLERSIVRRIHGKAAWDFAVSQGAIALADSVNSFGKEHPFTRLVPDLSEGQDPDDVFSRIPYEKGFALLHYLQEVAGGHEIFLGFMRKYLQDYAHSNVSAEEFKQYYLDHFKDVPATKDIDWDAWYYKPGMPPTLVLPESSLSAAAEQLALAWHTSDVMGIGSKGPATANNSNVEGWGAEQVTYFLDKLAELRALQPLHPTVTRAMDGHYGLDASKNAEIRSSWYRLCLQAGDTSIHPAVEEFLKEQGRMKYLRPLYRALAGSGAKGKELAKRVFLEARDAYHPIAAKMVASDLAV